MEHTEKTTTRGLPMTTWLLIFCIFNLVVTLALFGAIMRRSHMTAGYSQNGYQTMMQGNRRNMMQ